MRSAGYKGGRLPETLLSVSMPRRATYTPLVGNVATARLSEDGPYERTGYVNDHLRWQR